MLAPPVATVKDDDVNPPTDDRRQLPDRRQRPTPFLSCYTFWGRRRETRRDEEQQNYYVDRLHPSMRKFLWGILGLALFDGVATLMGVYGLGAREANPMMAWALDIGIGWFLLLKYGVTLLALLTLLLHQFFRLVRTVLWALVAVYSGIAVYHLVLFARYMLAS